MSTMSESPDATIFSEMGYVSVCRTPASFADSVKATRTADWTKRIDDLLAIRNLEDDWDGEGSDAPETTLVDFAIRLAQDLQARGYPPPDQVHAGVNATIHFEWFTPTEFFHIEVLTSSEVWTNRVPRGPKTSIQERV